MKSCASASWARSRSPAFRSARLQQVLVHTHRALELAAAAEQVAQREVQLGGVGVVLHRLDEGVDGLVLLLVQQQVQALEVGAWRILALAPELAQVEARGHPAQSEGHRQGDQQPLEVEFHAAVTGLRAAGARGRTPKVAIGAGAAAGAAAGGACRSATRRWRHQLGSMASTPRAQPAAKATSTTITIGVRHSTPKNQCTTAGLLVVQRKGEQREEEEGPEQPDEELACAARFYGAAVPAARAAARTVAGSARRLGVDRFAQGLARLEVRHQLLGDHHLLAAARVAPDAGRSAVDGEAAEAADLDAVAARQRVRHGVEDGLDGELGVALRELREAFGEMGDEVGAGHGLSWSLGSRPPARGALARAIGRAGPTTAGPDTLPPLTLSACRAWRAAGRPGSWCRRSRARWSARCAASLPAGRRCPWP